MVAEKLMSNVEIIVLILTTFTVISGTLGNLFVVMIIIRQKKMHTIVNWFVLNLCICDLLIIFLVIPDNTIMPHVNWPFGAFACKYISPILVHFAGVCVLTHTCLGVARYAVLKTAMSGHVLTINHVRLTLVLVWLIPFFSLSVSAMSGMMASPVMVNENGVVRCYILFPDPGMKTAYRMLSFSLTYILPMIATGFAYFKIHLIVSKSNKHLYGHMSQQALQIRRNKSHRMNRALMTMYIMFGVTTLPVQMLYLIDTLGFLPVTDASVLVHQLFIVLFYGQVVTNPFVLFYMGEEYRNELYRLPGCICRPRLRRLSTVTQRSISKFKSRRKSSNALNGVLNHDSNMPAAASINRRKGSTPYGTPLLGGERASNMHERNGFYSVQNSYSQVDPLLRSVGGESSFDPDVHFTSGSSESDILPNGNVLRNSSSISQTSALSTPKDSNLVEENSLHEDTAEIPVKNDPFSVDNEVFNPPVPDNAKNYTLNFDFDSKDTITSTPIHVNKQNCIEPIRLHSQYEQEKTLADQPAHERAVQKSSDVKLSAYYDDGSLLYFYDAILGRVSLSDDDGRETNI
jgi:7 transmembrane receptor (rhodopsin family).